MSRLTTAARILNRALPPTVMKSDDPTDLRLASDCPEKSHHLPRENASTMGAIDQAWTSSSHEDRFLGLSARPKGGSPRAVQGRFGPFAKRSRNVGYLRI
jgi:hypothetical protein